MIFITYQFFIRAFMTDVTYIAVSDVLYSHEVVALVYIYF